MAVLCYKTQAPFHTVWTLPLALALSGFVFDFVFVDLDLVDDLLDFDFD